MPSVGMKRTTRVCRMKSSEARVLRSGRQLRPDSGEVKPKRRSNDGVEFNNSVKKNPKNEVNKSSAAELNGKPKRLGHEETPKKRTKKMKAEALNNGTTVDKMFGIVYTRKRKRNGVQKCLLSENSESKTTIKSTALEIDKVSCKIVSSPCFKASKSVRSSIQKRRSSLRRMRARNTFSNGALMSDLITSRRNGIPFSSVVSKNKLRSSTRNGSASSLSDMSSSVSDLMPKVESDSSQCSANVLIIEPDRCYREEGAVVSLELSPSKEWLLVIKTKRSNKYSLKADKFMRPSSVNRFTRAVIWPGDDNWKLEFPNRQDWVVFKDLYKECCERNVPALACRVIPVPGVREVSGYAGKPSVQFRRPDSYISIDGDEVSRALAKRIANYDMDLEDEEWLKKFNYEFFRGNGHLQHLSEDCFGHQVKKAPVVPQPLLRKRRSFKRQASHGRGKLPSLLQMAAQHDAVEEEIVMVRVEEARAAATRAVESAILKCQQAQMLLQNADMATYKAVMALRIAEAASIGESSEGAVGEFFVDEVPVIS
ncbi:hypothetical protein GOBAR_AA03868 [Gossypium barbadense]|uniref:Enhancer of polycomb-like protein n=1 Tax=Gossypium barbadense TaxID=3634 RepID=A0A2P5YM95_GOSBA|nr:hypothetical protein GOBAR_AA03868 [Gossypium barbadense]